jgi:hypothetical protein
VQATASRGRSFPRVENIRQQRATRRAALALAVAIAGITELEAMPLRVGAQAGGAPPPRAMSPAIVPAGVLRAPGLRPLAAREWRRAWRVVAPDHGTMRVRLSRGGPGKARQQQKTTEQRC